MMTFVQLVVGVRSNSMMKKSAHNNVSVKLRLT